MHISHIVAISKNNVIGVGNKMPWYIPGELSRFKKLTQNKTVIMGRITYESIEKRLENRKVIVISKTLKKVSYDYQLVRSIEEAMNICKDEVIVAGGGQIYEATKDIVDTIYLTMVDLEIDGDVHYPNIDLSHYVETYRKEVIDSTIKYTYYTYERR